MATPTTYGGGEFDPAAHGRQPDIILQANTVTEGICGGVVWDGANASRFHSLAAPGKLPPELRPYMTDAEFEQLMKDINYSIQWGIDQRRQLCPVFVLLWIVVGLGALLLAFHIFCYHYPKAKAEINEKLKPLRSKGLKVEFAWAGCVCEGQQALTSSNKIKIWLPAASSSG
mmetsp:Transcript_67349/g.144109  ORF Transcript_67349/g.144109 Transcript_67349/m.144109 type:complete len:172 (+) Transcript_67349:88-603(+)